MSEVPDVLVQRFPWQLAMQLHVVREPAWGREAVDVNASNL